ncbi:alpha/beta hydrolase fold protein [Bacillus methanolicus PB1]|uniref:Putative 2-succinyl-6-hydroxy-2,4-cyclohexadiene-1-carboxylate synthase n=1 Tax=Bacillus methanolicus PB1 TaxID=997296 RepID=I3DYN4_BACMT|nr:2-succinyl-6-hydroxy-2,4-cyclohexadiene-1-carboxylate synthase [Bacillus methanolicus]EIJ79355.1 alpha/beta hydrolase fold protein [Bacillus methanolicus PB1]
MKYVLNGVHYHVDTFGDGFPLILLHGFTGDSSTWNPFCKSWSSHSRLIMIDIIGHGKTESPEESNRYHILSAADDLLSLIEQLGIEKADILGYSMGGRLALTFAVRYPHRVRKLILESSSPGLILEEERQERRIQDEKLSSFILEKGIEPFISYWENIPLFRSQQTLPKSVRDRLREQRLKNSKIGLANSLIGMGTGSQPSWWDELEYLPHETLLVTGSFDQKFCGIAKKMKIKIKNCRWININGCGHAIHVEEPKKFDTIVSEFLTHSIGQN